MYTDQIKLCQNEFFHLKSFHVHNLFIPHPHKQVPPREFISLNFCSLLPDSFTILFSAVLHYWLQRLIVLREFRSAFPHCNILPLLRVLSKNLFRKWVFCSMLSILGFVGYRVLVFVPVVRFLFVIKNFWFRIRIFNAIIGYFIVFFPRPGSIIAYSSLAGLRQRWQIILLILLFCLPLFPTSQFIA